MEILIILSGFIFACLVALLYECKIRQMRKEPRNKVRFYVTTDAIRHPTWMKLWMGKPVWDNKYLMWTRPSNHVFFLMIVLLFRSSTILTLLTLKI